jgi:hypothetical protein
VSIRDEWRHLRRWRPRHERLLARLGLVVLLTLVVDAVGTTVVYALEHDAAGSRVHTVFDAFFFTTVQLLTVSSQLPNPVTTGGRIVDMLLEVWAVIVVAGSAGAIASFFADDPRSPSSSSTMD